MLLQQDLSLELLHPVGCGDCQLVRLDGQVACHHSSLSLADGGHLHLLGSIVLLSESLFHPLQLVSDLPPLSAGTLIDRGPRTLGLAVGLGRWRRPFARLRALGWQRRRGRRLACCWCHFRWGGDFWSLPLWHGSPLHGIWLVLERCSLVVLCLIF